MSEADESLSGFPPSRGGKGDVFPSTHWSWVEQVRGGGVDSEEARERLCGAYWRPLCGYAQRRGLTQEDAKDAVQEFFAAFLRREGFEKADRSIGKLRAFLLGCFNNCLKEHFRKTRRSPVNTGDRVLPVEPSTGDDPERLYHRDCASELLNRCLLDLRAEMSRRPLGEREWEMLGPLLDEARNHPGHVKAAATALGLAEATARSRLHRMRLRLRALLRNAVAATLVDPTPEAVDAELEDLMRLSA